MANTKTFCAQVSRETQEPFIGTATITRLWLLIEYTGAWEARAIDHSTLPEQVKAWINGYRKTYSGFRPMFIRQHHRPLQEITCFVGVAQEQRQVVYRFTLQNYKELTNLDLDALVSGNPIYDCYIYSKELYFVCTDGKHDMCCAKFGRPIYNELVKYVGNQAWQCSHLGGDKFAANILYLPLSIYYGRMTVEDIKAMLACHHQRQLYLEKCRGRTCYEHVNQAAEHYLHTYTGNYSFYAFNLVASHKLDDSTQLVTFEERHTNRYHQLTIAHEKHLQECMTTCKGCWRNSISAFWLTHYQQFQSMALEPVTV